MHTQESQGTEKNKGQKIHESSAKASGLVIRAEGHQRPASHAAKTEPGKQT